LGNAYNRAVTGEIEANGFRTTGFFPCGKNIFRRYNFPLSSEDKHAALLNHPASVNTNDQQSSSSANFSPFISAVPLRSSDISSVPSLNLKPNPRVGATKNITRSPCKRIVEATQKKKIKQATASKTNRLASNGLLGPSKRWCAENQLRLTLHQIWTLS
jgi:hypothetical protein